MKFLKVTCYFIIFILTVEAEYKEKIWLINNNISKPLDTLKEAEGFSIYNGELAYVEGTTLHIGDKKFQVGFKKIQSFIKYNNNYFVCPDDENAKIIKISDDQTIKEIDLPFKDASNIKYKLKCLLHKTSPRLIVAFIGYKNAYEYNYIKEDWEKEKYIEKEIIAIDLYEDYIIYFAINDASKLSLECQKIIYNSIGDLNIYNTMVSIPIDKVWKKNKPIASVFYREEIKNKIYLNSYSFLNNGNGVEREIYLGKKDQFENPLTDYPANLFNYIRGTFAKYEPIYNTTLFIYKYIEESEEYSHLGIIDQESNVIMFNIKEKGTESEIYPVNNIEGTSRGIVIKTNGKYSIICPSTFDSSNVINCENCREQLIIDHAVGNQCSSISSSTGFWTYNLGYYVCKRTTHFSKDKKICQGCSDGETIDSENGNCLKECSGEINNDICKDCKKYNQYLVPETKVCADVPDGYYVDDNNKLNKCHESCQTCQNAQARTQCAEGYGKTSPNDQTLCFKCFFTCKYCVGQGTEDNQMCEICIDGYTLNSGKCDHKCYPKYFGWEECIDNCPEDSVKNDNLKICSYCPDNKILHEQKCLENVPEGYYVKVSENGHKISEKCIKGCKTCDLVKGKVKCFSCIDNYFLVGNECESDCPDFSDLNYGFDKDIHDCVDCPAQKKYINVSTRRCFNSIPLGYYVEKGKDMYKLKDCLYNCDNLYSLEGKIFCQRSDINHRCYFQIKIDEDLTVSTKILKDNSQKISEFSEKNEEEQEETLISIEENLENIMPENIIDGCYESILMNQLLQEAKNQNISKEFHSNNVKIITQGLTCDKIKVLYKENKNAMLLLPPLTLYYSLSNKENFFNETQFLGVQNIVNCIIENGIDYFDVVGKEITKDFLLTGGSTTNKLITILDKVNQTDLSIDMNIFKKNLTYRYSNAIVKSDSAEKTKAIVQKVSKMLGNDYEEKVMLKYSNLDYIVIPIDGLTKESFIKDDFMISLSNCNDLGRLKNQIDLLKFTVKICIPYNSFIILYPDAKNIFIIDYHRYPTLNPNITTEVSKEFRSIVIRDSKNNELSIKNLTDPIKLILKKSDTTFNNCIFYDETSTKLNSSQCTTMMLEDDYVICSCNHLTDFSLSKYDPVKLFKDLVRLFKQARIITSFEAFSHLNKDNAIVLYIILGILLVYFILLGVALYFDLRNGEDFFLFVVEKEEKCCDNESKEEELKELAKVIVKNFSKNLLEETPPKEDDGIEIEMKNFDSMKRSESNTNISIFRKENDPVHKKKLQHKKKICCCNNCKIECILFKEFFKKDYWICTFFNGEKEVTKTNILTIFTTHLIAVLAVCSMFTECGSQAEIEERNYNNRDFAVSIATILILEIPFTIFEALLSKTKITPNYFSSRIRYKMAAIFRYFTVYLILIALIILSVINTTWISLDSKQNGIGCRFLEDFFVSVALDCFVFQIIVLLIKVFIYHGLIKWSKSNIIRNIFFCIISSLPWVFNL